MPTLLNVQSSSNLAKSASRDLSGAFISDYLARHPGTEVVTRDLVAEPLPHLGIDLLGGFFGKPETLTPAQAAALSLSDRLVAELAGADVVVLAVPMYNFSIPSALKAWIDHVVRAGRTFQYTATGPKGLLSGKRAFLFLASGGVYSDGPFKPYDFQETYLRTILSFVGITDVAVIRAEGLALGPDAAASAIAAARSRIDQLAA